MPADSDLRSLVLATWRTNNRVTTFLFENLPAELWPMKVPGAPRRTVRMIAGHIHNARCMWIKWLGAEGGITRPRSVDRHRVTPKQLVSALQRSSRGIESLLEWGLDHGGTLPAKIPYRNIPPDVIHFLAYLIAHEGHHRGQICMLARELGHRLPNDVASGLWQWARHAKDAS